MKILILISLLFVSFQLHSYPIDSGGNIIIPVACVAKGDVTLFAYTNREKFTLAETLAVLDKEWKRVWAKDTAIRRSTYVDMQRVIRDVYRKDPVSQKEVEDATIREISKCMDTGF